MGVGGWVFEDDEVAIGGFLSSEEKDFFGEAEDPAVGDP